MLAKLKLHLKEVMQSIKFIQPDDFRHFSAEIDKLSARLDRISQLNSGIYIDLLKEHSQRYSDKRCISAALAKYTARIMKTG